jgi:preprotein translocase subunit Sss1
VLFDLQSPGRRRVLKIVYGALAVLFFVGFVGFGVGSDVGGGGIADIFGGGGSAGDDNPFEDEVKSAEETLQTNPKDQTALLELTKAHLGSASQQADVDEETGASIPTSEAGEEAAQAIDAWTRYLAVAKKPDPAVAGQVATAYFLSDGIVLAPDASGRLAVAFGSPTVFDAQAAAKGAADAQAILATAQPGQNTYGTLALYLYYAGDTTGAQAATQKALAEVGAAARKQLEMVFKNYEQLGALLSTEVAKAKKQQGAGAEGGGGSLEDVGGGLGGGGLGGGGLTGP